MEFLTEIIVASLAMIGTAIGSFSGFKLTSYRVSQLEKKVDYHNSFATRIPVIEQEINSINHRVKRLEENK